jgi:uncharacterized membrane protein
MLPKRPRRRVSSAPEDPDPPTDPEAVLNAIKSFLKATLVGGLMFLVPLILVLVVLRHAMQFAGKAAKPIAAALPASESMGVPVETLVAIAILLSIAFAAGLISRTRPGRRITEWFEESILGSMPQYRMVKSMAEGLTQIESGDGMKPVLMRTDECWQLGYWLEDLPGGWSAVFLPAAPTPMSGNVVYVASERIRPLDLSMPGAMKLVKRIGIGSAEALRTVDLGPHL